VLLDLAVFLELTFTYQDIVFPKKGVQDMRRFLKGVLVLLAVFSSSFSGYSQEWNPSTFSNRLFWIQLGDADNVVQYSIVAGSDLRTFFLDTLDQEKWASNDADILRQLDIDFYSTVNGRTFLCLSESEIQEHNLFTFIKDNPWVDKLIEQEGLEQLIRTHWPNGVYDDVKPFEKDQDYYYMLYRIIDAGYEIQVDCVSGALHITGSVNKIPEPGPTVCISELREGKALESD